MRIEYNEIFWGDSTLEKVEIVYDRIRLSVYNDFWKKTIYLECFECVGITEFIVWDEIIIDNVFFRELSFEQSPMLEKVKTLYGQSSSPFAKNFEQSFYELQVMLIGGISFSVICKSVSFFDNIGETRDG